MPNHETAQKAFSRRGLRIFSSDGYDATWHTASRVGKFKLTHLITVLSLSNARRDFKGPIRHHRRVTSGYPVSPEIQNLGRLRQCIRWFKSSAIPGSRVVFMIVSRYALGWQ